MKIYYQYYFAE